MSDTVTVRAEVQFRAWTAPAYAMIEGPQDTLAFPVGEISAEAVDALAEKWLDQLYASRGEASPFTNNRGA